jgi:hypothetical protein
MATILEDDELVMLYKLSKSGMTVNQMSTTLRVTDDTVVEALAQRMRITPRKMWSIFTLRETHSLQQISEFTSVPVSTLLEILPESNLPADLQNQILALARQGQTPEEISHNTGLTVDQIITVLNSIRPQPSSATSSSVSFQSRSEVSSVSSKSRSSASSKRSQPRSEVSSVSTRELDRQLDTRHFVQPSRPSIVRRSHDARHVNKTWSNGDSYRGELLNDKPHGYGTMQYAGARSREYYGDWANGVRQGQGVFTHQNGQAYEGAWRDDKKHGLGRVTWLNGESYDGQWMNDVIEGEGTYTFVNGEVYRGSFKDYLRHGEGVQTFPDGGRYTGRWKEGKMHGEFTYEKGRTSRKERWTEGSKA